MQSSRSYHGSQVKLGVSLLVKASTLVINKFELEAVALETAKNAATAIIMEEAAIIINFFHLKLSRILCLFNKNLKVRNFYKYLLHAVFIVAWQ